MGDFIYDALDYIPVAGTLKNTCEAAAAVADGDYRRAFSKGFEAAVSGTLDAMSFGAGGAIAKGMSKTALKQTGKVVAREVACIGTACAVRAVRNANRRRSPRRTSSSTCPRPPRKQSPRKRSPVNVSQRPPRKQSPRRSPVKTSQERRPRRTLSNSSSDESIIYYSSTDEGITDYSSTDESITDYSSSCESTTDEDSSDESIKYRTSQKSRGKKTSSKSSGYASINGSSYGSSPQQQSSQKSHSRSSQSQHPNQNNKDNNNNKNQKRGPKRGHHIINNDVLKIYKSIIETFTVTISGTHYSTLVTSGHIHAGMPVYEDYHFPLPQEILDEIETELVVSTSEILADANAEIYGMYRRELEEAILEYMMAIYDQYRGNWDPATIQEKKQAAKKRLAELIEEMIRNAVFVDEEALEIWLKTSNKSEIEKKMEKLKKLREAVEQMLRALVNKAEVWAKELIKVIEMYLNPGRRVPRFRRF